MVWDGLCSTCGLCRTSPTESTGVVAVMSQRAHPVRPSRPRPQLVVSTTDMTPLVAFQDGITGSRSECQPQPCASVMSYSSSSAGTFSTHVSRCHAHVATVALTLTLTLPEWLRGLRHSHTPSGAERG